MAKKEHNYTLFGTASFNFINTLNEEKALKWLPYFFHCVDSNFTHIKTT